MAKHVFGGQIYAIVVQCGRSWQPFGDCRKPHKPLESMHLQNLRPKCRICKFLRQKVSIFQIPDTQKYLIILQKIPVGFGHC